MADDDKTFTQADVDKLMADLNAKHQEDMNALAGKLRAEFKDKEAKAKAEAEKLAKQANMSELEKANMVFRTLLKSVFEMFNPRVWLCV